MGKGEAIPNYTKVQSGVADSTIFMIFFFFPETFFIVIISMICEKLHVPYDVLFTIMSV
jgi:hypothetical protein